ncbi:MAG TPA: Rieske 2Fe-2S domain-containing protein [Mycobacteriales bacterium]|nr:Rieske 2Fe-2S domain-containing protein [Mycobacteriales bacterium]
MTDSHDPHPDEVSGRPQRRIGRRRPEPATTDLLSRNEQTVDLDNAPPEVDPREDKFGEWQVSALFMLGILATLAFLVAYFAVSIRDNLGLDSNRWLGGSLAVSLFAIGAGMIVWAKKLLPHDKAIQDRHDFHSTPEEEKVAEDTFLAGVDDMGLGKRKILRRTLMGALGLFPLPLIVMLRDLGPLPHRTLLETGWKAGSRLVDLDTKLPVKLGDLSIGGIQTVMPEGFTTPSDFALAPTMLIRFGPGQILSQKEANWGVDDHVAYSKICTHAGCPISLYEQQSHNLLCPCHQSTFDMARDAKVIFGPAARPLPQLRIKVDSQGYLYAAGPYSQPVGPSFWERR